MAELVISALLPVLFEKLASTTLKNIARYKGIDAEIKNWQRSLFQIQGLLADASQKEITSLPVKRWLNDLQHLAYDIDDVLDDLATEAIHREFNRESEGITSKVRKLIPACCTSFSRSTSMLAQLDNVTTKLKDLLEEKAALGLSVKEESRSTNKNRRLQTSMFDESSIVGREAEKEALVQQLLSPCDQNYSIVPIVGMGGVGKTTLARLLYDDQQVKDHFELKAWVCVSDEFDSFAICKVIFQSVSGDNKTFEDLNLLQVAIRDHLRGKRFLLVLDDVWSESSEDWETLVGPFHACAPGSKIIMTTRKDQLLKKLGYNNLNQLQSLSSEDALSLLALYALGLDNFDSHLSLKPHGEGIVKKCNSLPLALKALGRLLSMKKDEEYWKNVLDSEIWNLPVEGEIIPALKLSYRDLSARLKQLFAYCSLFPKDYLFDKEELVLLWMGEGFLHQSRPGDLTEERMGYECFDELLSRSFFQYAPYNESLFVMHDMMNDLATYVASEYFVRLDIEEKKDVGEEMLEKYRHMSFVREKYVIYRKFEPFKKAKCLRTFLATSVGEIEVWRKFFLSNKVLTDLLLKLPMLRVLCLSKLEISEVPESICSLRHLRYLNLSRNPITHLPENVCNLYNLETLVLCVCYFLTRLPNNLSKLKNLRHLDIRGTGFLKKMPPGISEMKRLQTLSKIIIGGESLFEITKLKELKNLCGKTSIVGLENVQNATHAREANLSQKRLSELELVWSQPYGSRNDTLEKEVLNELKPCNDKLMKLRIRSYGGLEFPNWVGDPSFIRLKHVSIRDCKRCTSLPPLGQLPLLKELFIGGLDGLRVIGLELLGTGTFHSLEIISFKDMPWWEKWSASSRVLFPCLQKLCIENCPELTEVSLGELPSLNVLEICKSKKLITVSLGALSSLNVLEINSCDSGVLRGLVQVSSSVSVLEIENISRLDDVAWRGVIGYLRAVEDLSIKNCKKIRYLWESEAVASKVLTKLKKLKVDGCNNLVSLGEKEEDNCRSNLLTSLMMLDLSYCTNIESCICPNSIETLKVYSCSSIKTISLPAQKLKSLEIWNCYILSEREWGGQNINNGNSMLEYATITDWSNLKSITKLDSLVHLTRLTISNCKTLESFPDHELSKLTSLKKLNRTNCPSIDASFPRGLWPPNLSSLGIGKLKKSILEWGPQNFPTSLVDVSLYGDNGVSSCSHFSHLLPSYLTSLKINEFENLELASIGLQHLTSLQHLSFEKCPNMMDLPEVLLPSLLSLQIGGSSNLKERCNKGGSYWPLIFHIPYIFISRYD